MITVMTRPSALGRFVQPIRIPTPSRRILCQAEQSEEVYEGVYGKWSIDDVDRREVMFYRVGLSVTALSFATATTLSFLPESLSEKIYDPMCFLGVMGFGLSLSQVHMYASEIKRTIQALWAVGVMGAAYLSVTQESGVAISVVQNPGFVWLVGPFFASMTGLAIKEGLCYGKAEAALLVLLIPTTLLAHLAHGLPLDTLHVFMSTSVALFVILALRKYTQPIKDDIGDKSVFTFLSLPDSEQNRILRELNES